MLVREVDPIAELLVVVVHGVKLFQARLRAQTCTVSISVIVLLVGVREHLLGDGSWRLNRDHSHRLRLDQMLVVARR